MQHNLVYMFWNHHEPVVKGTSTSQSGNRDLARFIQDRSGRKLWVLVRPGPYVCAEWDFGGLPLVPAARSGAARAQSVSPLHAGR